MVWAHFSEDYDHRWPSRAVTEFKAGMVVNVKQEVLEAAKAAGVSVEETTKPKHSHLGYESTPTREETKRERNGVRTVKTGGHGYDKQTGNPLTGEAVPGPHNLPDPADPRAKRSEPLREGGRTKAKPDTAAPPDHEEAEAETVKE